MAKRKGTETSLTRELEKLKPHDHLCLIYESPKEWEAATIPFIRIGLERGERCFYLADTHTAEELRERLTKADIDVPALESKGQLSITTTSDIYTAEKSFDPDRVIRFFITETEKAVDQGYPALRVTDEMTWVLKGITGPEGLLEYEAKLNRDFFPKCPCLAICQYDRRKFAPEIIKGVIMTHPKIIHGNKLSRNYYYIPADEFLGRNAGEVETQYWLDSIEREQRMWQELVESQRMYMDLVGNMKSGMAIYKAVDDGNDFIFVDFNRAGERIEKISRDEVIGKSVLKVFPGVKEFGLFELFQRVWRTGKPEHHQFTYYKDNRISGWRDNYVYKLPTGEVVAIYDDITKLKKAERELELRAELLDNASDSIFLHTLDGKFIYVNAAACRSLGYSKDALLKLNLSKIAALGVDIKAQRQQLLDEGQVVFESAQLRKDGSVIPVEVHARVVEIGDRRLALSIARDITERKKMQEQIILTDRLASIGEVSSGIAHELNNPLTAVIGFSEILLGGDVPEDMREDLDTIHSEAKRAANIVRNLLTFARKHPPGKQPVDINDAIQKALDIRAYEQKVNNIQVVTRFTDDLPEIMADDFRLQQVFLNIIINAEYFMTEAHHGGTLTITTEKTDNMVRASLADDGPGISKEKLGHIFDPFFTTKEVGKGTGLGLSICHGIITGYGGNIYAESEAGKGATFIIELPIDDATSSEAKDEQT